MTADGIDRRAPATVIEFELERLIVDLLQPIQGSGTHVSEVRTSLQT